MKKNVLLLALCSFILPITAQVITVDDTKTAQQLIEKVLINNPCVNATNFSASGDTFTPGKQSFGYFSKGTSNFPFEEGVVLSSSSAKKAVGPLDDDDSSSDSKKWLGDPDLDATFGIKGLNATVLEFDFVTATNFLSFKYIFASKEYTSNFPCIYSDAFAFLIKEKGSAGPYKNLAVIPDTSIPVASTTIHRKIEDYIENGKLFPGCEQRNEKYYNGDNTTTSPINFNGQTQVLVAQTDVIKGKTYHVKLVISDDSSSRGQDVSYDSAVFIEAGSFNPKIDLGKDVKLDENPICEGENYLLNSSFDAKDTHQWYLDNILLPETTPTFSATKSGKYAVRITPFGTSCAISGSINLAFTPKIILDPLSLIQCDEDADGKTIFDLTKVEKMIKSNNVDITSITYFTSLVNAQSGTQFISNSSFYTNQAKDQTLYVRVTNKYKCFKIGTLKLMISNNPIVTQPPIAICDGDDKQDGLYQFDLTAQVTPNLLVGLPAGLVVDYYLSGVDAITETDKQASVFKNTTPNQQTLYARIVNGSDCYAITPIVLKVNTFDPPNFENQKVPLCASGIADLAVSTGFSSYKWNSGESGNKITVTTPGDYAVTVFDVNGCQKTKKFSVKSSGIATITKAVVNDFSGDGNTIQLEYTGKGDYEFSLEGDYYQENPLRNVAPGKYKVVARDKNGCGISTPFDVLVLDYPRFFTPNGDGINEVWKIKNTDVLAKARITIFDKFGKLIKSEAINGDTIWDGTLNGMPVLADDYWFVLELNNQTIKGHFSLKR